MSVSPPIPAPGGAPCNATRRPLLRRWLAGGVILVLFLAGAAVLAWAIGLELGAQVAPLAALVAVVPLAIVVPTFLWLDRLEAEPLTSLVVAFGWGAFVATALSLAVNSTVAVLLRSVGFDADAATAVAVAPVVEETTKGLGVLVVLALRRTEFDGVLDGIVYAGLIAAGFAFGENILYLGQSLLTEGPAGLASTFLVRGVMSPFAHPLFTMWTGVGIGVAVTGRSAARFLAPVAGWVVAMMLHATWNAASLGGFAGWLGAYVLVQVPVFVSAIAFAVWVRHREARTVALHLRHYASLGWFSEADLVMLSDPRHRRAARRWAEAHGGRGAARAMHDFQDDAVDLALLRARALRGRAGAAVGEQEQMFFRSLCAARVQFTPRSSVGR